MSSLYTHALCVLSFCWLGSPSWSMVLASRANRRDMAASYFKKALAVDSFHWGAFQNLCQLGEDVDPQHLFSPSAPSLSSSAVGSSSGSGSGSAAAQHQAAAVQASEGDSTQDRAGDPPSKRLKTARPSVPLFGTRCSTVLW